MRLLRGGASLASSPLEREGCIIEVVCCNTLQAMLFQRVYVVIYKLLYLFTRYLFIRLLFVQSRYLQLSLVPGKTDLRVLFPPPLLDTSRHHYPRKTRTVSPRDQAIIPKDLQASNPQNHAFL